MYILPLLPHESKPQAILMVGDRSVLESWCAVLEKLHEWSDINPTLRPNHTLLGEMYLDGLNLKMTLCNADVSAIQRVMASSRAASEVRWWSFWELIIRYYEKLIMDYTSCRCNKSLVLFITVILKTKAFQYVDAKAIQTQSSDVTCSYILNQETQPCSIPVIDPMFLSYRLWIHHHAQDEWTNE